MDPVTWSLYGVLACQGPLWVIGHCPGMCGPLVIGFRLSGVRALLLYQAGKAVGYACMGALAGALGSVAISGMERFAPALLLIVAATMVVAGGLGMAGRSFASEPALPGWLLAPVRQVVAGRGGPFALGLALAPLPCGIVVWALGLAVASAHPLHGALLVAGLTVLTTPVLLAAHLLGGNRWLAGARARLRWLPGLTLVLGGAWLGWLAITVGAPGRCH